VSSLQLHQMSITATGHNISIGRIITIGRIIMIDRIITVEHDSQNNC